MRQEPRCQARRFLLNSAFPILNYEQRELRPRRFDVYCDTAPLALTEAEDAERGACGVTEHDRHPDVERVETVHRLEHGAEAKRHDDLRDDRDVERAASVARPLEATGVTERDR